MENKGYKVGQKVAFQYVTGGDDTPEMVWSTTGVITSIDKGLDSSDVDNWAYLIDVGKEFHAVNACNVIGGVE